MSAALRAALIELGRFLAQVRAASADQSADVAGTVRRWLAAASGPALLPDVREALSPLLNYAVAAPEQRDRDLAAALTALRRLYRALPSLDDTTGAAQLPHHAPAAAPHAAEPLSADDATDDAVVAAPRRRAAASAADGGKAARVRKPVPPPRKPLSEVMPHDDLAVVAGLDAKMVGSFKRLGLLKVADLLYHVPHRYDDLRERKSINMLTVGSVETVIAEVAEVRSSGAGPKLRVRVVVSDDSGSIEAVFFNQRWLEKQIRVGQTIVLSGKVGVFGGMRQFSSPRWERYQPDTEALVHTARLVPIHRLTAGLVENQARTFIKQIVDQVTPRLSDHLPAGIAERAGVVPLSAALRDIHFPPDHEALAAARRRLGFDEFLFIQLGVLQRKRALQRETGHALPPRPQLLAELQAHLPFALTGAQQRAIAEISADMARAVPMGRLLQGDVGSGKTLVAAAAALQAIGSGLQAALMAPTEILAEQHARGLAALLSKIRIPGRSAAPTGLWQEALDPAEAAQLAEIRILLGTTDAPADGVRVELLTGSTPQRERRRILAELAAGRVDLLVGTHALFTESVVYHQLGLVVVDEQHRFGVEQRLALRNKGIHPHLLVMTATPIPRTLTQTIYGDLDSSILDELPPGRQEIRTRRIRSSERPRAYKHLRKEISAGRQAFVICPLVEESETLDLPSAEEMYVTLQGVFSDLRIALLHGKMHPRDKDEIMREFRDHRYDILVATAVIEVGIDIPNASTILIEGADRFGLSQLHQFRGRVGRGAHKSYCILVSDRDNEQTQERLQALEESSDGFVLAEIDLRLRGPGEFFGTRQSGTPDLKIAQLGDTRLLNDARATAERILAEDAELAASHYVLLRERMAAFWQQITASGA